jgi:hypothetical protein
MTGLVELTVVSIVAEECFNYLISSIERAMQS